MTRRPIMPGADWTQLLESRTRGSSGYDSAVYDKPESESNGT